MDKIVMMLKFALLLFAVSATLVSSNATNGTDCPSSIHSKDVKRCLRMGDRFIKKYIINLRKQASERDTPINFQTCSKFNMFHSCVQPHLDRCPQLQTEFDEMWSNVYSYFSCKCSGSVVTACRKETVDLECFENEYWSELSEHCDLYYSYSKNYTTTQKCHYMKRRIECRERRVGQVCGLTTGQFTHTITKLLYSRHKNRYPTCDLGVPSEVFPESRCPKTFIEQMHQCQDDKLKDKLEFFRANHLVAKGGVVDIKMACKNFMRYRQCIKPLEANCAEEKNNYFSFDSHLRTYDMKMQLICINYTLDYQSNLDCYQNVVKNDIMARCDSLWITVKPQLENHNAHQFYCQKDNPLKRELSRLRNCYEMEVSGYKRGGCTTTGGAILDILTSKALNDPMYLNYKYEPYCIPDHVTLHTTTIATTTYDTTTAAATTKTTSHPLTTAVLSEDEINTSVRDTTETTRKKDLIINKGPNEINKPRTPRNSPHSRSGASRTFSYSFSYYAVLFVAICVLLRRVT